MMLTLSIRTLILAITAQLLIAIQTDAQSPSVKLASEKSATSLSQTAVFRGRTEISITKGAKLEKKYVAKIDQLGFANESDAKTFFNARMDNLISYDVDFKNQVVTINLAIQYAPNNWGLQEWEQHLKSKFSNK